MIQKPIIRRKKIPFDATAKNIHVPAVSGTLAIRYFAGEESLEDIRKGLRSYGYEKVADKPESVLINYLKAELEKNKEFFDWLEKEGTVRC